MFLLRSGPCCGEDVVGEDEGCGYGALILVRVICLILLVRSEVMGRDLIEPWW